MTKQLNEYTWAGLVDLIERASEELYRRGYEAGKENAVKKREDVPKLTPEIGDMLKQKKRDRIVEQAKADVEELLTSHWPGDNPYFPRGIVMPGYMPVHYVEFKINKEKRTVVALVRGLLSQNVDYRGIAKCAPGDCFNVHIGKAIALRRALGLEVPAEYLNAPAPTEVRVGDKIRLVLRRSDLNGNIETVKGFFRENKPLTHESPGHIYEHQYEIIDDSRSCEAEEVYE